MAARCRLPRGSDITAQDLHANLRKSAFVFPKPLLLRTAPMFRRNLLAVAAVLGIAVASIAHAAPITDVVFGNLGSSGTTGALSNTSTGITASSKVAQVFTTGSGTNLKLSSITLGSFSSVGATLGLNVFNDAAGAPGSLFAASTNTQTLGTNTNGSLVTWSFNNVQMSASTSYWIVPSTNLSWNYRNSFSANPTAQNGSGFSYLGAFDSSNSGSTWSAVEGGAAYAVSVQAVPEPTAWTLAIIGVAGTGLARWRRRASRSGR